MSPQGDGFRRFIAGILGLDQSPAEEQSYIVLPNTQDVVYPQSSVSKESPPIEDRIQKHVDEEVQNLAYIYDERNNSIAVFAEHKRRTILDGFDNYVATQQSNLHSRYHDE
jgi:hypothetical protein